jgi:hypothetical protein
MLVFGVEYTSSTTSAVARAVRQGVKMNMLMQRLGQCFSAGSLGGLANSLALWGLGAVGVTAAMGVSVSPSLSAAWLYPRLVWGGIWGFLFLLPICRQNWWLRGVLFGLGPALVQLLVVFPLKADKGYLGLDLGTLTPLVVLIVNLVWGLVASWAITQMSNDE